VASTGTPCGRPSFLYIIYLTVLDLGNFSFIVCLTIFIFALLGMQLFGGKMCGLDNGRVRCPTWYTRHVIPQVVNLVS